MLYTWLSAERRTAKAQKKGLTIEKFKYLERLIYVYNKIGGVSGW